MYRFAFVMDQQVGLKTQSLNFERVVAKDKTVSPLWVPVSYSADAGFMSRLSVLPAGIRGTLRGVHEIRESLQKVDNIDGILWGSWAAKSVLDLVSKQPSFLILDMTPVQMEMMGELYNYSKARGGFLSGWKKRATLKLYTECKHLFAWNQWVADSLKDDYAVPESKISVISPGVDINLFRPDTSKKPSDGVIRLLFVGGDFHRKGGDLLLKWARTTRATHPWEVHIVTRDDVPATPGVVVHKGIVNNSPELIELYQTCDLFVLPTRADTYTFVSMEAMASGLPLIVSRIGGIPEIVDEGRTGYLVDVDDFVTLSDTIDLLVDNNELRLTMAQAARRRAVEHFDCDVNLTGVLLKMKAVVRV